MRAFALDTFGAPGSVHELPDPKPAEGEVRVRVRAASINPFDNFVVMGHVKDRMEHRFPLIPCGDLSGTVDAVGTGVSGFATGDEVFGVTGKMVLGLGTLAELATATASTIARRPDGIDDVEAAAMPLAGVSALMSVQAVDPKENDVMIVIGASGGIGGYAVQLARTRGAHVIGVTSTPNLEYVKSLGAAEVVDRNAGDLLEALRSRFPQGVAALLDTASDQPSLAHLSQVVRKGGIVTSMRGSAAVDELAGRGIKGVNIGTQVTTDRLVELAKLRLAGKIKRPRIRTFTLEQAGEAFEAIAKGGGGKIVVTV